MLQHQSSPLLKLVNVMLAGMYYSLIVQVDCTAEGDLCASNQVHSYPTLVLFESGKRKTEYRGARDLQSLEQFLSDNTK